MLPKISAFLIVKNEAANLPRSLAGLDFVDEIIVVDSGSTDETVKICRQYKAKVLQHQFTGYGQQKLYSLSKTKNEWVLSIDADEVVSPELKKEILGLDFTTFDGFEMPRLTYFLGKPIRHGGPWWYPGYVVRLFKKSAGKFSSLAVHEKVEFNGKLGRLKNDLQHYSYNALDQYLEKMNQMTSLQAQKSITPWKNTNYIMIFLKPLYRFCQMYFWYLGFLDGFHGFMLAVLSAFYVVIVYFKSFGNES